MRKALIFVALFVILSISFTATMIRIHKISNQNETVISAVGNKNSNNSNINSNKYEFLYDYEKTVDPYSTFKESSIKFLEKEIDLGGKYGTKNIMQISGLKDKIVENKINNDIKERYVEKIKEIEQELRL